MSDAPRALEILQRLSHGQPGSGLAQVARLCAADMFARRAGQETAWQSVVHALTLADERAAAAEVLDAALDLNPESPDLWLQAVALQAEGFGPESWARAPIRAYALAARLEPVARYRLLCLCGEASCKRAEWEFAEQVFEAAVTLRPDAGRAHQGLATVLAAQDRPEAALDTGLNAVARGAGDELFLTFLESLAERSGRFDLRENLERARPLLAVDPRGRQAWLGAQFAARQIVLEREDYSAAALPLIEVGRRYLALVPLMFQEPGLYRVCQAPELQQLARDLEQRLGVPVPRWEPPVPPGHPGALLSTVGRGATHLSADDRDVYWVDLAWYVDAVPVRRSYVLLAETSQEAIAGARIAAQMEQIRQDPAWAVVGEVDPRVHPATAHLFVDAELESLIPEFIQRGRLNMPAKASANDASAASDADGLSAWRENGAMVVGAHPPRAAVAAPLLVAERQGSPAAVWVRPWHREIARDD